MSQECSLNFDQWKTFSENYVPVRACNDLFTKLLRIICRFRLLVGILPPLTKQVF